MKKKLGLILLVLISVISIFTLSACKEENDGGGENPSHVHNFSKLIPEVSATCISEGSVAHYHCDGCGKNFDAPFCYNPSLPLLFCEKAFLANGDTGFARVALIIIW